MLDGGLWCLQNGLGSEGQRCRQKGGCSVSAGALPGCAEGAGGGWGTGGAQQPGDGKAREGLVGTILWAPALECRSAGPSLPSCFLSLLPASQPSGPGLCGGGDACLLRPALLSLFSWETEWCRAWTRQGGCESGQGSRGPLWGGLWAGHLAGLGSAWLCPSVMGAPFLYCSAASRCC